MHVEVRVGARVGKMGQFFFIASNIKGSKNQGVKRYIDFLNCQSNGNDYKIKNCFAACIGQTFERR